MNLNSLVVLRGSVALEELDLSGCKGISNVDVTKNLTKFKKLNPRNCEILGGLRSLETSKGLEELDLDECKAFLSEEFVVLIPLSS